jgi:hypothetical protein
MSCVVTSAYSMSALDEGCVHVISGFPITGPLHWGSFTVITSCVFLLTHGSECVFPLPMTFNVFARSNARIVGLNPTQGMDVCLCLICVCIGSSVANGLFLVRGAIPTVLGVRN